MERWFVNRRKNKVLELAFRQMAAALDTANDLERAIGFVLAKKNADAKASIERLFRVESEIDELRRQVFEEVTKGNLPHQEREDIMHLVKRLDQMADHVKDSARNVLVLKDVEIPSVLWEAFHGMSRNVVETASVLSESLRTLSDNPAKAREISEKVEAAETKVDQNYVEIKSLFLEYGEKLNPAALLLLKDLLDSMEEAADSCADTGDYIRVLTVSFK